MKKWLLLLFLLAIVLPNQTFAQSNVSIKFVKPGDRRNVELGEIPVTVAITGVSLQDGFTWRVLIDGDPQPMVSNSTTTKIVMPQPSGPHRLKAELYDAQGKTVGSDEILVLAAPIESQEPVFNRAWYAPAMAVFVLVIIGLLILGLRLRPRITT